MDEKSAIQALDRLDRRLPLSPGRAERHGFEYYRHGTLSLYAALNPQTGELIGQTAARHTSQEFVAFLEDVVATQPAEREVHVILDNFSAHRTALVNQFLQQHPNVAVSLHTHLFVVAQPGRKLVQQTPAGCNRSRHIHFRDGSQTQNHALHPSLPKDCQTISVEIFRCPKTDPGLVAMAQGQPTRTSPGSSANRNLSPHGPPFHSVSCLRVIQE